MLKKSADMEFYHIYLQNFPVIFATAKTEFDFKLSSNNPHLAVSVLIMDQSQTGKIT